MTNSSIPRPRSHNELAALSIANLIANASDELHDRDRDDIADALPIDLIAKLARLAQLIHDDAYAHQTAQFDDTIPMTDDDADELSFELPDAADDAICCQRAHEMIYATLYAFDARSDFAR